MVTKKKPAKRHRHQGGTVVHTSIVLREEKLRKPQPAQYRAGLTVMKLRERVAFYTAQASDKVCCMKARTVVRVHGNIETPIEAMAVQKAIDLMARGLRKKA